MNANTQASNFYSALETSRQETLEDATGAAHWKSPRGCTDVSSDHVPLFFVQALSPTPLTSMLGEFSGE
jgi:hypothetical protein